MSCIIKRKRIISYEDKFILVNCINGSLSIIDKQEKDLIDKFTDKNIDSKTFKKDYPLIYNQLDNNGFIYNDELEEDSTFFDLVETMKNHSHSSVNEKTLYVILSYKCNFSCSYCYEGQSEQLSYDEMSYDMMDKIIERYKSKVDHIIFFGGEPLLPTNFKKIDYFIKSMGKKKYSVVTNGYYIEESLFLFENVNVGFFQVTLDGTAETHNITRKLKSNDPTFEKIIKGIGVLVENDYHVKIRMNITEQNIESCLLLRDELIKTYCTDERDNIMFELQPIFQLDYYNKNELVKKLFLSDYNVNNYLEYKAWKNTIKYTARPLVKYLSTDEKLVSPTIHHCKIETSSTIVIDSSGDLYTCVIPVGNKNQVVGNIYEGSKEECKIDFKKAKSLLSCMNCKDLLICGGGCLNINEEFREYRCKDFNFELQELIPELVKNKLNIINEIQNNINRI